MRGHPDREKDRAFREFVEFTEPRLRAYASVMSRDRSRIDDVIQDAFLVAWRRFGHVQNIDSAEQQFYWLCNTLSHCLRNIERSELRHQRRIQRVAAEPRASHSDTNSDDRILLHSILSSLSPQDRMVAVMTLWDDARVEDIADALGCSVDAAYKRRRRLLDRIGAWLSEEESQ